MANPILKYLTIFGSNEGYGWTEVHYKQASALTPQLDIQLNNFILGVGAARQTLLGEDCFIAGFRVSYKSGGRIRSNGKRQKLAGAEGQTGAAPALSLAVEMQNTTFDASKIIHLRGFWDGVELDESYRPELVAGWDDRLAAWKNALISGGYGWPGKDDALSLSKGIVLGYTVAANMIVTFNLDPINPMPAATVGKDVLVRFSKFHDSRSVLNRQLLVNVEDVNTLRTLQPIACDPVSTKGRVNYSGLSFIGYANSDSISLGRRPMGRPLNRQPGRQRAKART